MCELIKSVSGIRGVFGNAFNPKIITSYAAHFGLYQANQYNEETSKHSSLPFDMRDSNRQSLDANLKKIKILVGRDTRTTGDLLAHAVIAGLMAVGVDVIYLGIVSTPTLLLSVKNLDAQGGICITASHNPSQWNALKLVGSDGMFLTHERMTDFLMTTDNAIKYVSWDKVGRKDDYLEASFNHIKRILSIEYIDIEKIRKKKFTVALDSINGAGCFISATLLRELGCNVIEINNEPTGIFAHSPEPLNINLSQLSDTVLCHKADIGFVTDPDVDRLAIIDENGIPIGEEYSLLLAEKFVLSKKKGDIVTNLSSSMASDDIAKEYGVKVHRTKIGEINVGKKMQEINSPIGGEGNGGIICPEVNYTRDALVGMALILAFLTEENKKISDVVKKIPKYYFKKDKIDISELYITKILTKLDTLYSNCLIDKTDGFKLIFDKAWVHIRKSGTEPIIRVYAEAETQEKADNLCNETINKLLE